MYKSYNNEDIEEMIDLIDTYDVEYDGCGGIGCEECSFLENCYHVARQRQDSEWAKLINYGGYDNEDEFWEELLN